MKKTLLLFTLAAAGLLLTACSCEWRLARLQERCPDCLAGDTLVVRDTVVPPPVTVFEHIGWDSLDHNGTFVIERPDYTFNVTVTDAGVDIEGEVRPDTIYSEIKVPVTVPCPTPTRPAAWQWMAAGLTALVLILAIILALKKTPKNQ